MEKTQRKILTFPLRLALILLIYGALFKFMHWPYANSLMLFGSVFILVFYSIRFLSKNLKTRIDYVKLVFVLVWVFNYMVTAFHWFKLPYIMEIVLLVLFLWWLIEDGYTYFKKRTFKGGKVLKYVFYGFLGFVFVLIAVGILFKIQHWPYGNIMFTLGILLLSAAIIIDYLTHTRS